MIPETIPSLLLIFESAITQFSSIIYVAAANQFLLPKCGVRANQFSPHRGVSSEQFSLPHHGVSTESVSFAELWCQQQISFLCRIVVSATN
jgi:hypothetical protein